MTRRAMVIALFFGLITVHVAAQTEAEVKYIVKTASAEKTKTVAKDSTATGDEKKKPVDFFERYFHYLSICDWHEGMRFMVIPTQQDLVVKTFTDSVSNQLVSSMQLRHKIMIYNGHESPGGMHDRINFTCEEDGKKYYFEVPTRTFDDFCYGKAGIPTLAYLGDVDSARVALLGRQVNVKANFLYQDTEVAGDGYKMVEMGEKKNTRMTIKAIGVGTRNYPVKIIVKDRDSIEYFQMVAMSRINSGMRDDQFEQSDILPHTFQGSFDLIGDNMAVPDDIREFIGKEVYLLSSTNMEDPDGKKQRMAKLSAFIMNDVEMRYGSDYAIVHLTGKLTKKKYTKEILLAAPTTTYRTTVRDEEIFSQMFAIGNPLDIDGVRQENLSDISKGMVKVGFTEAEVLLTLGEPSDKSTVRQGIYTWTYQYADSNRRFQVVVFNANTKKVRQLTR